MDAVDRRLLRALQTDSNRPLAELAEAVGLSSSACHRRIKMLEADGVIEGYAARLAPRPLGFTMEVFVRLSLTSQSEEALAAFETACARFDEILECHLTTGEADYMLRVAARDIAHYDEIHRRRLARLPGVASMKTSFALRSIKPWRGYPVEDA